MSQYKVTAVIIGRGGSKGLPNKNRLPLLGRPVIAWTVQHALRSRDVTRIIVSSDSEDILDAAMTESSNIETVLRPADLADDHATVDAAVRQAITATNDNAPIVVILYANVPVRPDDLIDRAVESIRSTGADSVQSYADVSKHHPWWMVTLADDGSVVPYVENTVYRRQDLPPVRLPDGGVIAVTREALFTVDPEHPHAFLGSDRKGIETQYGDVIDIDTAIDLAQAEATLRASQNAPSGSTR